MMLVRCKDERVRSVNVDLMHKVASEREARDSYVAASVGSRFC